VTRLEQMGQYGLDGSTRPTVELVGRSRRLAGMASRPGVTAARATSGGPLDEAPDGAGEIFRQTRLGEVAVAAGGPRLLGGTLEGMSGEREGLECASSGDQP
jgi:hypothetical protein